MMYIGYACLLLNGMLWFVVGERRDICAERKGNVSLSRSRTEWEYELTFVAQTCNFRNQSLLLYLRQGQMEGCWDFLDVQDHPSICDVPNKGCLIISKDYNQSPNPTKVFPECARIIWIPLKNGFDDTLTLATSTRRPRISFQYELVDPPVTGMAGNSARSGSSSGAVIALAILFTITLLGLIVLLVIMFKQEIIKIGSDIKLRFDEKISIGTKATSSDIYAVAEDPSIYQEVEGQRQSVENELYHLS